MDTIFSALKASRTREITALAAVLLAIIVTGFGIRAMSSESDDTTLSTDQQLIPVQYGDLVNQVSTNGSLMFPNRELLTFGSAGTVAQVLVIEGEKVKEGQALASLDSATIRSLEKAVAKSRVDFRDAEEKLLEVKAPPSALSLAQAEADLAKAEVSLKNAQEALEEVKASSNKENIAEAEISIRLAELSVSSSRREITQANAGTDLAKKATLADTQKSFDTALAAYEGAFRGWLGIILTIDERNQSPATLLATWGVDLDILFAPEARYKEISVYSENYISGGLPPDDPNTRWDEEIIYARLNFYPGTIRPTCGEQEIIPSQQVCIQREMENNWGAFRNARDTLETVQAQVAKALATAEKSLAQNEEKLTTAQETLAELLGGPDSLAVASKRTQLAVAQAKLDVAQDDLSQLLAGSDSLDVALREAQAASAKSDLAEATEKLANASLLAPMDGVVSLVNVEVGERVNTNNAIVEIVDPTVVELDGIVDEIDVLFVQEGARATITMEAMPGRELEGTVSTIATTAQTQQGVVTYPIRVNVMVPRGVQLREGLSATASIVIQEENNVLLVPLQALYGTFEEPVVRIMADGTVQERAVVLGNSDDYWVAIREGLAEGDQVIMAAAQASTSRLGIGATFRQLRGDSRGRGNRGRDRQSSGGGGGGGKNNKNKNNKNKNR